MSKQRDTYRSFADVFRMIVGRGRMFSIKEVARGADFDPRTIQSYQRGETEPRYTDLRRLKQWFADKAPEFANSLEADSGYALVSVGSSPMTETQYFVALSAHDAECTRRRLDDGKFCEKDKAATAPSARRLALAALALFGHRA